MAKTITSANAVFLLGITGLYPTAQQLKGFAADAAFATGEAEVAETVLGVDGKMSYGWLPQIYKQTISIMPDSDSAVLFEDWNAAENAAQEKFPAFATITFTGTNRSYILTNGVLSTFIPLPDARKVLQSRNFVITWNTVLPAPI